eukprot:56841-Eustigmatos_ZCMA.PRE.1
MNIVDAAAAGDLQRVRALVEQNAGLVNAEYAGGWTPFMRAAFHGHVEVARHLLDHGATIDHRDHFRQSAVYWACITRHAAIVLLLLQRGADVTVRGGSSTLLIVAPSLGSDGCVHALLKHGEIDVCVL